MKLSDWPGASWPLIGCFTHSERVLTESGDAVPHLVLAAAQRDERRFTVTRRRQHTAQHTRVLDSVLRPHVTVMLEGGRKRRRGERGEERGEGGRGGERRKERRGEGGRGGEERRGERTLSRLGEIFM